MPKQLLKKQFLCQAPSLLELNEKGAALYRFTIYDVQGTIGCAVTLPVMRYALRALNRCRIYDVQCTIGCAVTLSVMRYPLCVTRYALPVMCYPLCVTRYALRAFA